MSDRTVTTSFRLPSTLKKDIADIAKSRQRPSGFIIVEALNHYLDCQTTKHRTTVRLEAVANGSAKKKAGTR